MENENDDQTLTDALAQFDQSEIFSEERHPPLCELKMVELGLLDEIGIVRWVRRGGSCVRFRHEKYARD